MVVNIAAISNREKYFYLNIKYMNFIKDFVYKILGYFYDEISYDVTEFKIELKI